MSILQRGQQGHRPPLQKMRRVADRDVVPEHPVARPHPGSHHRRARRFLLSRQLDAEALPAGDPAGGDPMAEEVPEYPSMRPGPKKAADLIRRARAVLAIEAPAV